MSYYLQTCSTNVKLEPRYYCIDEALFRMVQMYKRDGIRCFLMDADTNMMRATILDDGTPKWIGPEGWIHTPGSYL